MTAAVTTANKTISEMHYGQCWEDTDILIDALEPNSEGTYLSIASAGDNALAILSRSPKRVIALDSNPAQLSCLALRVAAYRTLTHAEMLELLGSRHSTRRYELYQRCRPCLAEIDRNYWDANLKAISYGIAASGKFERYFSLFRRNILPLIHSRKHINQLLKGGTPAEREQFYKKVWNTWRWRLLFKVVFCRFIMHRLGADPSYFHYVEGSVAKHVIERTHHVLTELNPANNPYLQWILTGQHTTALPYALRQENFAAIRANLDRLEWRQCSLDKYLSSIKPHSINGFNLSDIFGSMSETEYHALLSKLLVAAAPGARLVYWNMLTPRRAGIDFSHRVQSLDAVADNLFQLDKAFFYSAFVVEQAK